MRAWLRNLWADAWCLLRCGKTRKGRYRAFAQAASDALGDCDHTIVTYDSLDRIRVLDKRIGTREKTKALPTKSPDFAHAFILGVRQFIGQIPEEAPPLPPDTGDEVLWQMVRDVVKAAGKPPTPDPYRRRT